MCTLLPYSRHIMNIVPPASSAQIDTPLGADIHSIPQPAAQNFNDSHPLEKRVANWRANEEAFKLQLLQRSLGAAEPIRRQMEIKLIEKSTFVPEVTGGPSNLHLDILRNQDASIDWEDVHKDEQRFDFQQELQKRMGL